MDKYEYKVRAEEIKGLIAQKKYTEAVKIADGIDWTRVRSILMLCTVSDLYKINRRLEESRDILLMAYERNPNGRTIVYSLCELSIKLGDVVQAVEYYKEYVQLAPKDTGRYILQYKLYEAQEVGLEERIAVLEEFKKRDYREKWAYELSYLYHRVGLATRCVEECDDLILWFGEGKYVMKAMELKMLHQPLSRIQQKQYNLMKGISVPDEQYSEEDADYRAQEYQEEPQIRQEAEMDIQIKPMRMGQYDTINLQQELAENMKEFMLQDQEPSMAKQSTALEEIRYPQEPLFEEEEDAESITQEIVTSLGKNTGEIKQITPLYDEEYPQEAYTDEEGYDLSEEEEYPQEAYADEEGYDLNEEEEYPQEAYTDEEGYALSEEEEYPQEEDDFKEEPKTGEEPEAEDIYFEDYTAEMPAVEEKLDPEIARMLSQEYDGQISLVVPESEKIEKQITGQMSIEDILAEWERMKRANEQKRAEDVRKRVLEQTGAMFSEFDASTRNGILEQLEEAAKNQAKKEQAEDLKEETAEDMEILEDPEILEDTEISEDPEDSEPEAMEEEPEETGMEAEDDLQEADSGLEEKKESDKGAEEEEASEKEEEHPVKEETTAAHKTNEPEETREGRALTVEETDAFGSYIQTKHEKAQIIKAIDSMTLAPYTGNVIITGDTGVDKVELAKELIKEVQQSDSNFSGKVAKISGQAMNSKDIAVTLKRISNGALIIEKAGDLKKETLTTLNKVLEKDNGGIIILMEDTKKAIDHMLEGCKAIQENFNARIDIEALSNDALVSYGKKYANELEYALDDLSMLALYTRIADMQTSEHVVTAAEVREIIDEAIDSANRKNIGHFKDLLLAKRYDEEDMVILREKDFIAY